MHIYISIFKYPPDAVDGLGLIEVEEGVDQLADDVVEPRAEPPARHHGGFHLWGPVSSVYSNIYVNVCVYLYKYLCVCVRVRRTIPLLNNMSPGNTTGRLSPYVCVCICICMFMCVCFHNI